MTGASATAAPAPQGGRPTFSFIDGEGRPWLIAITIGLAREVKRTTGANLGAADLVSEIKRLCEDRVLFVDVLFAVCQRQARERGLDQEAFAAAVWGAAIDDAESAFIEALIDFSPSPRLKERVGGIYRAVRERTAREAGLIDEAFRKAEREIRGETSGGTSGIAPASSVSTPPV